MCELICAFCACTQKNGRVALPTKIKDSRKSRNASNSREASHGTEVSGCMYANKKKRQLIAPAGQPETVGTPAKAGAQTNRQLRERQQKQELRNSRKASKSETSGTAWSP